MPDPATPDSIESALFAQLEALGPTSKSAPVRFRAVRRYENGISADALANELVGHAPAALLRLEREVVAADAGALALPAGRLALVARSTWLVYVVVKETRGTAQATKGTAGTFGLLAGMHAVIGQLAGLRVDGLHRGSRVEYVDTTPVPVPGGVVHVLALRFAAERSVELAPDARAFDELEQMNADFNLPDASGWPENPVDQIEVDLTES